MPPAREVPSRAEAKAVRVDALASPAQHGHRGRAPCLAHPGTPGGVALAGAFPGWTRRPRWVKGT